MFADAMTTHAEFARSVLMLKNKSQYPISYYQYYEPLLSIRLGIVVNSYRPFIVNQYGQFWPSFTLINHNSLIIIHHHQPQHATPSFCLKELLIALRWFMFKNLTFERAGSSNPRLPAAFCAHCRAFADSGILDFVAIPLAKQQQPIIVLAAP